MAIGLRAALRETLRDWREDIDPRWRGLFHDVELAFEEIDAELRLDPWEPIFPSRRGKVFPGAPAGAHMFRAFDGLSPESVRCVILGQDPYPCPAFSTGRAFETGNVARWRELDKMFSPSMRTVIRLVVAARTGAAWPAGDAGSWPATLAAIERGDVTLEAPGALADRWVASGVLLLNSSLTLSRFKRDGDPHQLRGHLRLWHPLLVRLLGHLARRETPIVFIVFGDAAARALGEAGLGDSEASAAPRVVLRPHPAAADDLMRHENPFALCNRHLQAMGAAPVDW